MRAPLTWQKIRAILQLGRKAELWLFLPVKFKYFIIEKLNLQKFSHTAANDLPPIHLHCLRHTFATLLIYLGNDTKAVSSALGHSQTQITNDTYIHIFEEHNARISDSLCNDLLNTATE